MNGQRDQETDSPAGAATGSNRVRMDHLVDRIGLIPIPNSVLIGIILILMLVPLVFLRGYHLEEGHAVVLARGALEGERWWLPQLFGHPWSERPILMPWIIAGLSLPFDDVPQIMVRLPVILSLFCGAMLILFLLRPYVSRTAVLLAAACFLFSPNILAKIVTAESNIALSVVQFAAFVLWWRMQPAGINRWLSWIAIGVLLGATALFKGPQPAAFFPLGIGAFILIRQEWRQMPGFIIAGIVSLGILGFWYFLVWDELDLGQMLGYMRLSSEMTMGDYLTGRLRFLLNFIQFGPAGLMVVAAGILAWKGKPVVSDPDQRLLLQALLLYSGVALAALAIWPGGNMRYSMPAFLPLVCVAGLSFEELRKKLPGLTRAALTLLAGLMVYQFAWSWIAAPLFSEQFDKSRTAAESVRELTAAKDSIIYAPLRIDNNMLAYLNRPVRYLGVEALMKIDPPAYLVSSEHFVAEMKKRRSDLDIKLLSNVTDRTYNLYELK